MAITAVPGLSAWCLSGNCEVEMPISDNQSWNLAPSLCCQIRSNRVKKPFPNTLLLDSRMHSSACKVGVAKQQVDVTQVSCPAHNGN